MAHKKQPPPSLGQGGGKNLGNTGKPCLPSPAPNCKHAALSNRLPIFADEIVRYHLAGREAFASAAEYAIKAGEALIEAKKLVKHGDWLPWLRANCKLSERTAQLYMRIAAGKEELAKNADVADLSLRAAARSVSGTISDDDIEVTATENPFWLEMKLARICRMPEHVRYALMKQIAFGVPALAMIPDDDLIEAIKCLNKTYLENWAKTDLSIELLITVQAMIVELWKELVDEREGLDDDAWWQRAKAAAEQLEADLAEN